MSTNELSPLRVVEDADIEIEGRMPWSSNATFAVFLHLDGQTHRGIYKPVRGERPLWDFEAGLYRRERAAYVLSEALEFHVVPPTIVRDGPLGIGSVQWYVDADHSEHYFTIYESRSDLHDILRDIAILDIAANNTDRKSGHCLIADDRVWAIDNGLCFAAPYKVRTVIWDFAGDIICEETRTRLDALASEPPAEFADLLNADEVNAFRHRCATIASEGTLPHDETGQRYPWPLI
jgi:uncharacterized repeat protein (TIGR03843 family)